MRGFLEWFAGFAGLIAVLIAVPLGLATLIGTDEDSGHKHHAKQKPDPQCGRYSADPDTGFNECHFEIERYCEYGAVSRAQLAGCEKNVRWGQVKALNTNAARFARLQFDACLGDSGPFCATLPPPQEPDY